jgi:catalase
LYKENKGMTKDKKLTTASGIPVPSDQASITTGPKEGYTLLGDAHLTEKLAHFNRERIPERVVHAKGAGAHGVFEVTNDLSAYTSADFLSKVGKKTEVFARFSTVGGEKGSADSERDPRGFAVRFYTEEGNYDLVGNNTPVFFIRDAIKFPDFIHTQKRNPQTNLKDANMFWDFLSLTPESMHQVTILFSDRGTPLDHRHMNGYGSHTFMWYNQKKEYVWVKYHFKTDQKNKTMDAQMADAMKAKDPDHSTRDLFDAIERGDFPTWSVYVQIMTSKQAENYPFDPFDVTKVWYQSDFPLIPLGKMTLNKNPENYFEETEQVAFAPSNLVRGIGWSPDKLLQGRLFAYHDAHLYRLGTNHQQIPINRPKHMAKTYQRDGSMSVEGNGGKGPNYWPNSLAGEPSPDMFFAPPPIEVKAILDRHERATEDVDFIQPGELYRRVMNEKDREHLINNVAGHLINAKHSIQMRQCALFYKTDKNYGTRVANALALDLEEVKRLSQLSQEKRVKETS